MRHAHSKTRAGTLRGAPDACPSPERGRRRESTRARRVTGAAETAGSEGAALDKELDVDNYGSTATIGGL